MRILSLEIHGFKSFAQGVRLEFDSGVAAVVGPNGSGKSNLVEAVRWVLGEQSLSQLRGKRTEDVIWGGTKGRAPAGMAEVSVTFDNADRTLPTPFSEVTITRRAYRSGENEYMINRTRVRLRDVSALVSALGQGYTVVSQGTADAALSLTPEGRRGLFEEAADITQHYARRDESLRRLSEMETNSARVLDVLAELEPRLRTLARQARQARERETEEAKLRGLQTAYYAREIRATKAEVEKAELALQQADEQVRQLRQLSKGLTAEEEALREALESAQTQIENREQARTHLLREEQVAAQASIVSEGREADLGRRLAEAEQSLLSAEEVMARVESEEREAAEKLQVVTVAAQQARAQVSAYETQEAEADQQREDARRALNELRQKTLLAQEDAARARNRVGALRDRLQDAQSEHGRRAAEEQASANALQDAEKILGGAIQAAEETATRLQEQSALLSQAQAAQQRLSTELRRTTERRNDLAGRHRELQARHRLLEELRESGAGLNRATQAVLKAGTSGQLGGIVGALASLIEAPEDLEQAIESVLGGALQNVVTRQWRNAEDAIAMLRRTGSGRVTFLPLDTLRPQPSPAPPTGGGMIGIAAELVRCDDAVRPAVQHSLGRVLIVQDLPSARALVDRMRGLSAVVTLAGETLRPGGAVTGGAAVREGGTLAREREWRHLPEQIGQTGRALEELDRATQSVEAELERAAQEVRLINAAHVEAVRKAHEAQLAADQAERVLHRRQEEQAWLLASSQKSLMEQEEIGSALLSAEREQKSAESEAQRFDEQLRLADEVTREQEKTLRETFRKVSELRTQLAVSEERLRSAQDARHRAGRARAQASEELVTRRDTIDTLERQYEQAAAQTRTAREHQQEVVGKLQTLDASLVGPRHQLQQLRQEVESVRLREAQAATESLSSEEARLAASAALVRAKEQYRLLISRATLDTGLAEITPDLEPPEGVEERIAASVQRLARIGPVNALAAQEYEELQSRAAFLEQQVTDIRAAQEDLGRLIASIEDQMERRFEDTFKVVSDRFGRNFERLFGGGSARLALVTKGESLGVEIQAQPPGKRLGNLALLSGGERALTSSALLFALIQAGGAPFCVLDEVDAALDESNVGRFCDLLEELSRDTQFIVVTHNRGTIERASRLYGVSMESTGVSKVLSLRLETPEEERESA